MCPWTSLSSIGPPCSLSSSTVFAFFYVKDKVLFWRRASIYMFWGVSHAWHWLPRAFSLFLQMQMQMHTLHIDTWTCISDHWWAIRESHGTCVTMRKRVPYHFLKLENKHRVMLCCMAWCGGTNHLHLFTTTQYYRVCDREGIFINAALIHHHSQLSRLFLSIKIKSHSFLLLFSLRLSTSLLSSIFFFLSFSLSGFRLFRVIFFL